MLEDTCMNVDVYKSNFHGVLVSTDGKQLNASDEITVYHGTSSENSKILLASGTTTLKTIKQPTIIDSEEVAKMLKKKIGDPLDYEPGRGIGTGLYVSPTSLRLAHYGECILSVKIKISDLSSPPERPRLAPIKALLLDDGYTESVLPANAFSMIKGPTIAESWVRKNCKFAQTATKTYKCIISKGDQYKEIITTAPSEAKACANAWFNVFKTPLKIAAMKAAGYKCECAEMLPEPFEPISKLSPKPANGQGLLF